MNKTVHSAYLKSAEKNRLRNCKAFARAGLLAMLVYICGGSAMKANAQDDATKKKLLKGIDGLPSQIAFTPNMGQYDNKDILYTAKAPFGHYTLTPQGLIMGIYDTASVREITEYQLMAEDAINGNEYVRTHAQPSLRGTGILLQFAGANTASLATTTKTGESSDHSNWLLPGKAITDVHSYSTVTYTNLYNGVDVKYYTSTTGDLENDVIVKPGADASQVAMEIKGANGVNITADGKLQMVTAQGPVEWLEPVSYLKDSAGKLTQIKISYISKGTNKIGFSVPAYDKKLTLVIDPAVIRWSTIVSTNANVTGSHNHGVSLDAAGNIYVAGNITASTNNALITVGPYQATAGSVSTQQTFVAKYTEPTTVGGAGTRVWQTYLVGDATSTVNVYAINVGPDGYVYICGTTSNTMATTYGTFPAPSPTYTNPTFTTGSSMGYIAKIKADGTGAGVRAFKGSAQVVTGSTTVTASLILYDLRILPGASSTFSLVVTGPYSGPGVGNDVPSLVSPAGTVQTYTTTVATVSSFSMNITSDLTTKKWTNNIGIAGTTATGCASLISSIDYANNVYLGGYSAVNGLNYNGSTQTTLVGTTDGWLMKLNSTGVVQYSRYVNSSSSSTSGRIISMEMNRAATHLIAAGYTTGLATANVTGTPYQSTLASGVTGFFVQKIPISGAAPVWGTYLSGTSSVVNLMGINVDANDDIYILGYSNPAGFPTTAGRVETAQNATETATFSKLKSDGTTLLYSTTLSGSTLENDPVGERGIQFANCRIYLAISSESNDFPLTQNAVTTAKLTPVGSLDPMLVSIANPPDFNSYTVSPTTQSVVCNTATASNIVATATTYNVPRIIRNGTVASTAPTNTTGTATEYPVGYGLATITYQWQQSIDDASTWTNITNATSLTLTPGTIVQTTNYRLIVNGDACNIPTGPTATITATGAPTASPSSTCSGSSATIAANATGTGLTYAWTLPANSTRGTQTGATISLTNVSETDAGIYSVTVTNTTGCKTTKTFTFNSSTCSAVILPIDLVSFKANTSGCGVTIDWVTASELNNAWFVLERSTDGINYVELQRIKGAGTSVVEHSYNYVDNVVQPLVRYYYRLRQIDIDGKATYSTIATAVPWCAGTQNALKVFPIPASSYVNITGLVGTNNFLLYDVNGKKITAFTSANSVETINLNSFAKGVYILKVTDANGTTTNLKIAKD